MNAPAQPMYLADEVGPDHIDFADALPADELAASLAPAMAQDAERFRMVMRLAAEDDANYVNYTDEPGPLTKEAQELAGALDVAFPDAKANDQLVRMLDLLIEKFGSV